MDLYIWAQYFTVCPCVYARAPIYSYLIEARHYCFLYFHFVAVLFSPRLLVSFFFFFSFLFSFFFFCVCTCLNLSQTIFFFFLFLTENMHTSFIHCTCIEYRKCNANFPPAIQFSRKSCMPTLYSQKYFRITWRQNEKFHCRPPEKCWNLPIRSLSVISPCI